MLNKKIRDIYLSMMPKITASLHGVIGTYITTPSISKLIET
jgi:hypothetical protein